ncbi:hypothetical protein DFH06DRAFT_1369607 [Mycena polygramma]|nr:hypothetical protein DFH06DRAFT_1369607 [Mycena polygramma]
MDLHSHSTATSATRPYLRILTPVLVFTAALSGMASDNLPDEGTVTSNDRLIKTLERCFSDLMDKQEEQSEKFQKALEALKPKPPATDKKTAFWSAYKTLADEHDKEFQQKYSTDLDTALIFAGLFSAVDSAFIIQIQPDIQPRGTPLVILVAQNLLYVSLGSTLLAALLAVLGKQWLMFYMAAGERGTIEARGLERQRKLDGLRRWKFDMVMQLFPLLLQFGLFLFSSALSTYLWSIHLSLALVVLSFTAIGFVSYTALLISAVVSPDSPFQTPLAPLVARLLPRTLWMKSKISVRHITAHPWAFVQHTYTGFQHLVGAHSVLPFFANHDAQEMTNKHTLASLFEKPFPTPSPEVPAVSWVLETSTDPRTVATAAEMVIDLQWPGNMDVQPQLFKLRDGILSCFEYDTYIMESEIFFRLDSVRGGMSTDVMHLGRAYCTLGCVQFLSGDPGHCNHWPFPSQLLPRSQAGDERLNDVLSLLTGSPGDLDFCLSLTDLIGTRWALNVLSSRLHPNDVLQLGNFLKSFTFVIPKLDAAGFADYLFCILALLSPPSKRGTIWKDKSSFIESLLEYLFDSLASNIQSSLISMETAATIINTTIQIILCSESKLPCTVVYDAFIIIIYEFCASLPRGEGWIDVVLATGLFRLTIMRGISRSPQQNNISQSAGWVYEALDCIDTAAGKANDWDDRIINGVAVLLDAILYYGTPVGEKHIHILLRALALPGDVSRYAGFLLIQNAQFGWFRDEQLQPIIKGASAWVHIMRIALDINTLDFTESCIHMGSKLVQMPYWKPHVHAELCSWIRIFFKIYQKALNAVVESYNSVLEDTCQIGYIFSKDRERALGLSYHMLCNIWRDFKIATLEDIPTFLPWLRCTSVVVSHTRLFARGATLAADSFQWQGTSFAITTDFETAFCVPLRELLFQAETVVGDASRGNGQPENPDISLQWKEVLEDVAQLLEDIAIRTLQHADPEGPVIHSDWELIRLFENKIATLEGKLKAIPAAAVVATVR